MMLKHLLWGRPPGLRLTPLVSLPYSTEAPK